MTHILNGPNEAGVGAITLASNDYLSPIVNRDVFLDITKPDIMKVRGHVHLPEKAIANDIKAHKLSSSETLWVVFITTVASAFIFITIIAWATVLQSFFDYKVTGAITDTVVYSRIYYALTITGIAIVVCLICIYAYNHMRVGQFAQNPNIVSNYI